MNCSKSELEYTIGENNGTKDRCDVYVETSDFILILELDATRADQVAKKMLSRYYFANKIANNKPTAYVYLLYPGTAAMNPNECVKYMNMGKELPLGMNPHNRFIGGLLNEKEVD